MTYIPETGEVIYRSKRNHTTNRLWETFDAPAFIAAITRHIPAPGQHLVRYYGAYSNRARGERRKQAGNAANQSAAETSTAHLPVMPISPRSRNKQSNEQRAESLRPGTALQSRIPTPACQLFRSESDRFHRGHRTAPQCLSAHPAQKVARTHPEGLGESIRSSAPTVLAHMMRISGLLEDRDAATALLEFPRLARLRHRQPGCARAPPPPNCSRTCPNCRSPVNSTVLSMNPSLGNSHVRRRLERYARQRDQIAGIVVYDGEFNETSGKGRTR
jgi:hypothetical protein